VKLKQNVQYHTEMIKERLTEPKVMGVIQFTPL